MSLILSCLRGKTVYVKRRKVHLKWTSYNQVFFKLFWLKFIWSFDLFKTQMIYNYSQLISFCFYCQEYKESMPQDLALGQVVMRISGG